MNDTTNTTDDPRTAPIRRRRDYQRTASGGFKSQPRDPTRPGAKISITARTSGELAMRVEAVRQVRRDLKYGAIGPRDAARALAGSVHGVCTVDDLWKEYARGAKAHLKRQVQSVWVHRLAPWFEGKRAWELDESLMRRWLQDMQAKGYAVRSIRGAYDHLAAAFNLAIRVHKIAELPWGKWRAPTPKRGPMADTREACRSLEEFVAIVHAAQEQDGRRWKLGRRADLSYRVITMGLCGLRNGEAGGLGWDDVEIDSNPPIMHVRHQVIDGWSDRNPGWSRPLDPPKNGVRMQQLHPAVVAALWAQRDDLKKHGWYRPDGPIFPGPHGAWRLHHETIDPESFRVVVRNAGLPNVDEWVTHSLRHTFATLEVVASGGDLRSVQARTGHSSIEMLEKYLHASGRGLPPPFIPANLPIDVHRTRLPELEPPKSAEPEPPPLPYASGALVDLAASTYTKAREYEEELRKQKNENRKNWKKKWRRNVLRIKDLANEAAASGADASFRPPSVTIAADNSYSRAYAKEMARSNDPKAAREAGRLARRGLLGAWAVELRKAIKRRGDAGPQEG